MDWRIELIALIQRSAFSLMRICSSDIDHYSHHSALTQEDGKDICGSGVIGRVVIRRGFWKTFLLRRSPNAYRDHSYRGVRKKRSYLQLEKLSFDSRFPPPLLEISSRKMIPILGWVKKNCCSGFRCSCYRICKVENLYQNISCRLRLFQEYEEGFEVRVTKQDTI